MIEASTTRNYQGLLASQKVEARSKQTFLEHARGTNSANTLCLDFKTPERGESKFSVILSYLVCSTFHTSLEKHNIICVPLE